MELQAFEKYFKLPLYVVPDSGVFIFSQPNEKKNLVIAFNWLIKVDNFKKQKLLEHHKDEYTRGSTLLIPEESSLIIYCSELSTLVITLINHIILSFYLFVNI